MQFSFDTIEFKQVELNTIDPVLNQNISGDDEFSNLFIDSLNSQTNIHADNETVSVSKEQKEHVNNDKDKDDDDDGKETSETDEMLDVLEKYLVSKGVDLDNTKVDSDGMDTIKEMLIEAGADEDKLNDFFEDYKADNEDGVNLSDLLASLKEADLTPESETGETWLPISETANLTGILSLLGLNDQEIQNAFKGAKEEGKGIELSKFVENLQSISAEKGDESSAFVDKQAQEQIQNLLSSLEGEDVETGPMSLSRFVGRLKSKITNVNKQDVGQNSSNEIVSKFKNEFLEQLNPVGKNEYVKADISLNHSATEAGAQKMMENQAAAAEKMVRENIADQTQNKTVKNTVNEIGKESLQGKDAAGGRTRAVDSSMGKNGAGAEQNSGSAQNSAHDNGVKSSPKSTAQSAAPRTLPKYVMNQVSKKLSTAVANGENQVKINLKPPRLGRIHMSITETDNGVSVSIMTEQNSTKDMLNKQTSDLASTLAEQGVKLDKVEIQLTANFDEMMANQNKDSRNTKENKRGKNSRMTVKSAGENKTSTSGSSVRSARTTDGNLDLVA